MQMRSNCVRNGFYGVFLGLVTGGLIGAPAQAAPGDIYNLGVLPGGGFSQANDLNASGQVIGYSQVGGSSVYHAFLYTGTPGVNGQMFDLGSLGGSNRDSFANAISDAGHIVGDSQISNGSFRAFLYTGTPGAGGQMINLGTLPGGQDSYANDVNNLGQVVGEAYNSSGRSRAFLYTGGTMYDLGTLPGGTYSWATAINDSGQIVGSSRTSSGYERAFLYTGIPGSGGSMQALPLLPGGFESWAYDINNAGQIVGEAETADGYTAFLYNSSTGQIYNLGNLGDPESYSRAVGINSLGHIVGISELGADDGWADRAFLYVGTPGVDGHMINLDAWLDQVNPVEGAKWTLYEAYSINDSGLIAGYGWYESGSMSGERAFLLDASSLIPEPASAAMFALGSGLLLRRRRAV